MEMDGEEHAHIWDERDGQKWGDKGRVLPTCYQSGGGGRMPPQDPRVGLRKSVRDVINFQVELEYYCMGDKKFLLCLF